MGAEEYIKYGKRERRYTCVIKTFS